MPHHNLNHKDSIVRAKRQAVMIGPSAPHPYSQAVVEGGQMESKGMCAKSTVSEGVMSKEHVKKASLQTGEPGKRARSTKHTNIAIAVTSTCKSNCNEELNSSVSLRESCVTTGTWLQRKNLTTSPEESVCSYVTSTSSIDRAPPSLSLFPPFSPITNKREYVSPLPQLSPLSPLSPLNNGRDAYGNYIPTNTLDYFTAKSPPTSPVISPIMDVSNLSTVPSLRGGGSWLNNIGFARNGKDKSSTANSNISRSCVQNGRQDPPRESIPIPAGSRPLTNINSNYGRSNLPVRDKPRNQDPKCSTVSDHKNGNPKGRQTHLKQPENMGSHFAQAKLPVCVSSDPSIRSYSEQTWSATGLTETPTISLERENMTATPPIPVMNPRRKMRNSVVPAVATEKCHTFGQYITPNHPQREPKDIEPDYDSGSDIKSLIPDESVSVAGQARDDDYPSRFHRPRAVPRETKSDPSPEEIEVWQNQVQARFKACMQEIMAIYNANISSIKRALRLNQISQEFHDKQAAQYNTSMEQSLKSAAEDTGYVILDDPTAIKKAMHTLDGYMIYHDLLQPTKPDLWQQLDAYHQQQLYAAQIAANKPPKSSWDQGVHVAGKIARFLLAAPSDPELKTYSNRRPRGFSEMHGKDKGKGRATEFSGDKEPQLDVNTMRSEFYSSELGNPSAVGQPSSHWTGAALENQPGPSSSRARRNSFETGMSMWPEGDSQGNWRVAKGPALQGGKEVDIKDKKGKKTKKKGGKQKYTWFDASAASSVYMPYGGRVIIR